MNTTPPKDSSVNLIISTFEGNHSVCLHAIKSIRNHIGCECVDIYVVTNAKLEIDPKIHTRTHQLVLEHDRGFIKNTKALIRHFSLRDFVFWFDDLIMFDASTLGSQLKRIVAGCRDRQLDYVQLHSRFSIKNDKLEICEPVPLIKSKYYQCALVLGYFKADYFNKLCTGVTDVWYLDKHQVHSSSKVAGMPSASPRWLNLIVKGRIDIVELIRYSILEKDLAVFALLRDRPWRMFFVRRVSQIVNWTVSHNPKVRASLTRFKNDGIRYR